MIKQHPVLGSVEFAPVVTQGMVESYFDNMGAAQAKSFASKTGNVIRAACEAGIIVGVPADEVSAWTPARCLWVAKLISDLLNEAMTIPPE